MAEYLVSSRITMLCADGLPLPSVWRYRSCDPYVVVVDFPDARGGTQWIVGRELVTAGLRRLVGLADVQMWPTAARRVALRIGGEGDAATLTARSDDVAGFLAATYRWVPAGRESEWLDLDAALVRLLAEGSAP